MEKNRNDFVELLDKVKPGLSRLDIVPQLKHFCFDGKFVTATNGQIAFRHLFESEVPFTVPGDLLCRFLSTLTGETVSFSIEQQAGKLQVACGFAVASFLTAPTSEFPKVADATDGAAQFVLEEDFCKALSHCRPTISGYETFHVMTYLQVRGRDVFSTDNTHISWAILSREYPEMYLTEDVCDALLKLEKGSAFFLPSKLLVDSEDKNLRFIASLPAGIEYPDCKSVFDRVLTGYNPFTIPPALRPACERATLFASTKWDRTINMRIEGDSLIVFSESPSFGKFEEKVQGGFCGDPKPFAIRPESLVKGLPFAERMQIFGNFVYLEDSTGHYKQLIATASI